MNEMIRIFIKDALLLPQGFIAKSPARYVLYCRVPADWLENEEVKAEKYDLIFAELYGKTWQNGNEDGSRYIVEEVVSRIVSPAEQSPWLREVNDGENIFLFYDCSDNGKPQKVSASEL